MDEITGMSETELRRQIVERLASAKHTAPLSRELAQLFGVARSTVYRALERQARAAEPAAVPAKARAAVRRRVVVGGG